MPETSWAGFGAAVRRARVAAGMSQAELGVPTFSRSYISLVELGLRAPTSDMVAHLAQRLGMEVREVQSWAVAGGDTGAARAATLQAEALSRLSAADLSVALKAASDLRSFALDADRLDLWWTATVMDLTIKLDNDRADEVTQEALILSRHWFTAQSPILSGRVRTILASSLRLTGHPDEAIAQARVAITDYQQEPQGWPANAVAALTTLVSTLGQQRRYPEALAYKDDLATAADGSPNSIEAGSAYWALANLALRTGNYERGHELYLQAMSRINPDTHLRKWGRLHRAAADFHLEADFEVEHVPDLLAKAQAALELSHCPSDLAELTLTQGKHAIKVGDYTSAKSFLSAALAGESLLMPDEQAAAHHYLGTAYTELGEPEHAVPHLRRSIEILNSLSSAD